MADNPQDVNLDRLEDQNSALGRVNRSLDALGGIVGAIVRGAPQSFGDILDKIPGLDGKVAESMKFAEGYIGVWQGLTRSGVNFNNKIDDMITATGRANIQLEKLASLVTESGAAFASIGGIAQAGVDVFLANQATFMEKRLDGTFDPLRVRLEQLGYTAETITESFLAYDQIQAIQGIRDRRTGFERNRAAAEFASSMDELARLTGKQIDQLEKEAAEISRQGNIFAFGAGLQTQVKDELRNGLQELNEVAPVVKDFATDLITRGFPNPDDPAMMALNAAAPELRETLLAARDAFLDGDETRARILMDSALAEAKNLRNNQFLIRQGMLGSATEITSASQDILTQLNSGIAVGAEAIRARAAEELGIRPEDVTREQFLATEAKMIEENRKAQIDGQSDSQKLLNSYLEGIRELQSVSMSAQETLANGMISVLQRAVDTFSAHVSEALSLTNLYENAEDSIARTLMLEGMENADKINAILISAQSAMTGMNERLTALSGNTDTDAVASFDKMDEIKTVLDAKMTQLTEDPNNVELQNEITSLTNQIRRVILQTNPEIYRTMSDDEAANILRSIEGISGYNAGTMGEAGKLFQNFGRETLTKLHGIEAVVTPEQMNAIVSNSALGAVQGISDSLSESRNTSNAIQGMLNTIRTIPAQMQGMEQTDNSSVEQVMTQLTSQLKAPLEQAMNNTLVPKLEQLVSVSSQNVEMSNKVRKTISNLDGDILRSV